MFNTRFNPFCMITYYKDNNTAILLFVQFIDHCLIPRDISKKKHVFIFYKYIYFTNVQNN